MKDLPAKCRFRWDQLLQDDHLAAIAMARREAGENGKRSPLDRFRAIKMLAPSPSFRLA
jgi:hypothetical protein